MKTLTLILLLILLPAGMICANGPNPPPLPPANEYRIEPGRLYSGQMILELIQALEDEAAIIAVESFEEGYKQGRIDGATLWKPYYDEIAKEAAKRPKYSTFIMGMVGTLIIGFASGFAVYGAVQ